MNETKGEGLFVHASSGVSTAYVNLSPSQNNPPKPPWYESLRDRNLEAVRGVVRVLRGLGYIGSAIGGLKTLWELFRSRYIRPLKPVPRYSDI